MAAAAYPYHKIAVVLLGNGAIDAGAESLPLTEGGIVRITTGTRHRFVDAAPTPMTLAVVCISEAAAAQLPAQLWKSVERLIPLHRTPRLSATHLAEVRQLVRRVTIESASDAPFAAAEVFASTSQLIVRLLRGLSLSQSNERPQPFAESLDWLTRHFTEQLNVEELAARAGLSYRGYTAAFRRHTGTTVIQYVNEKRLALAARLVRETGDIVTSAFEAGFGDVSHFYHLFVRRFGYPPGRLL